MPFERKKHKKWPNYVHEANGRIVYRPRINGKFIKPIRIGPAGMTDEEVWRRYNEVVNEAEPEGTLSWLSERYQASDQFKELADGTQNQYKKYARVLQHSINKGKSKFGSLLLTNITTPLLRQLLDKRSKMYINKGRTATFANREISYISVVIAWGLQYKHLDITHNPCKGIRRKKENVRMRYVEGAHNRTGNYKAVYDLASEREQIIMELTYCLACRGIEARNLKRSDRLVEGVLVERTKGSKTNIVEYSKRLEDAIRRALKLHKRFASQYLIPGINNDQLKESTLNTAMQRLRKRCVEKGIEPFALHDLKRTAHTDAEDDRLTGHKTEAMKNRYRVKPEIVKPAN